MLIPGLKVGPQNWQDKIATLPHMVEIWFRIDQVSLYQPIFEKLQKHHLSFGLHFWGITSTQHEANLAYPGKLLDESIEMMEKCIRIAHDWQAKYVNIHSGNIKPMLLNLDGAFHMLPDETMPTIADVEATNTRNKSLRVLGSLANQLNIKLLVELIPQATYNNGDRSKPVPEYPASPKGLLELCEQGYIGFTNDFCHTYSYNPHQFTQLTNQFLPYTYLCHINTIYEPFNGTDAHGGILPEDFSRPTVFPNQQQYRSLLQQLKSIDHDVWLVGEPSQEHIANYHALQNILQQMN